MSPFDATALKLQGNAERLIDGFGRVVTICASRSPTAATCAASTAWPSAWRSCRKAEVLSLEELDRLASAFVDLGVRKLRLTGGEPLVRRAS